MDFKKAFVCALIGGLISVGIYQYQQTKIAKTKSPSDAQTLTHQTRTIYNINAATIPETDTLRRVKRSMFTIANTQFLSRSDSISYEEAEQRKKTDIQSRKEYDRRVLQYYDFNKNNSYDPEEVEEVTKDGKFLQELWIDTALRLCVKDGKATDTDLQHFEQQRIQDMQDSTFYIRTFNELIQARQLRLKNIKKTN